MNSIKILGGERLSTFIDEALKEQDLFKSFVPGKTLEKSKNYIRRLTAFADKEGKTRTIAILDYFSQTVLKGFHRYLFKVLKKIPQDCTFDQSSFKDKIKDWDYFCSADLSAATDRFPLHVISSVLRGHLPSWYITAWESLMVEEPFYFKEKAIHYSVGNPMGAYSS